MKTACNIVIGSHPQFQPNLNALVPAECWPKLAV